VTLAFWLVAIVPWVAREVGVGLGLVVAAFALDSVPLEPLSFHFLIEIYPADFLFLVLGIAAASRLSCRLIEPRRPSAPLLAGSESRLAIEPRRARNCIEAQ
jgi:hypothetical protein